MPARKGRRVRIGSPPQYHTGDTTAMKLWPYILPLPTNPKHLRTLLFSVFGSAIAVRILESMYLRKRTSQKELVESLPCSNKTTLGHLRRLVDAGILDEGLYRKRVKGKGVWAKWYEPTLLGRWLLMLLKPPRRLCRPEIKELLRQTTELYCKSLARLCIELQMDPQVLVRAFRQAYRTSVHYGTPS